VYPSSYSHAIIAMAPSVPADTNALIATVKLSPAKVEDVLVILPTVDKQVMPCTDPLLDRFHVPDVFHPVGTVSGIPIKSLYVARAGSHTKKMPIEIMATDKQEKIELFQRLFILNPTH
jgi:hypothetical protein